ncbi:mucoidy inhibitor MuiA family protein [Myxococcus sp. K38C18041901]|uniref:mucoidy inhibitor MuiA family protein n=1 Tax=Myxococcus guangdongensis TaxID=2906760 RepID=UPI0020A7F535|nr:mucoidy inhibitor MuiA family protein [Myxococcus guangdongensis]MCP3061272.1 mucoidy inhibitor MuiA family protein [Myxococcus guangdongensis]
MLLLGLGWAVSHLLHASTEAPITDVTVYSDRARVVRTASLQLSGAERLELPLLPEAVDPSSIQVEAEGARVASVEVRPAQPPPFPVEEATLLLATLDRLGDELARVTAEHQAHQRQVAALGRIQPKAAGEDSDGASGALAPGGWSASAAFLVELSTKREARMRELEARMQALRDEREERLVDANRLGELPSPRGFEVRVALTGSGAAKVRLSYLVLQQARWYPRYELQLNPAQQRVQVAFAGLVSQETGEDWTRARLTLSTALPSTFTALPKLTTWKLGTVERFIPTARRTDELPSEPPPLPMPAASQDVVADLRRELQTRAQEKFPPRRPEKVARAPRSASTPTEPASAPESPRPSSSARVVPGSDAFVLGGVIDAQSRGPVSDVVVTATSPSLPGEEVTVTDAQGIYRLPPLPPGVYTLRFEKEQYKPYARSDIQVRMQRTLRVNVELLPESLGEVVEIVGTPPTIDVGSTNTGVGFSLHGAPISNWRPEPVVDRYVGLAPPPGWSRPALDSQLPASLAGGHDLAFTAPRAETVPSGQGERTIPLLLESWPVQVERRVFPALASEAYLVARLKSPSRSALPGGTATLFVGDDPSGTASLPLIVPGEPFTLPLGVDPAVRTARDVRLVQSKQGFISKDDLNTYEVTLEVSNPYPFAMQTQVVDQWPLGWGGDVESTLVRTEPMARQDPKTGVLRWDVVIPASSKKTLTFEYRLKRPQNWKLIQ